MPFGTLPTGPRPNETIFNKPPVTPAAKYSRGSAFQSVDIPVLTTPDAIPPTAAAATPQPTGPDAATIRPTSTPAPAMAPEIAPA